MLGTRRLFLSARQAGAIPRLGWNSPKPYFTARFNGTTAATQLNTSAANQSVEHPSRDAATSILEGEREEDVEKTTGVIEKDSSKQGLVYFDRVYPFLFRIWWLRQITNIVLQRSRDNILATVKEQAIPQDLPIKIDKAICREKDGGMFLSYTVTDPVLTVEQTEEKILEKLKTDYRRTASNLYQKIRMFPVKGTPWIEDLRRTSSFKLKVEFDGPDLSQEALYLLFRRYGPINDIVPPPAASKDIPRSAIVIFSSFKDAATARNCVNGVKLGDTNVHILFQPLEHTNVLRSWIVDHPRIVIPIVVALLAGLAVLIFEPIRTWFVRKKICGKMAFENNRVFQIVRKTILSGWALLGDLTGGMIGGSSIGKSRGNNGLRNEYQHLWDDRAKGVDTLCQWVNEGVNTFIIVNGPRGSGKESLVLDHALQDRSNVYALDCEQLIKARSDPAFLSNASRELGYYPVFPWMNNVSTFLDTIAQGLTGQKTGFSETSETQFKNMLTTATAAITQTALENKKKILEKTVQADKSVAVQSILSSSETSSANAQDTLGMSDENYLQSHPEERPVIVIKHFLGRSDNRKWVYSQLAEWAAGLVMSNVAHVIFITSDVGYEKILSDELPNQVFKQLTIGDANNESAKGYILKQWNEQQKLAAASALDKSNSGEESKYKAPTFEYDEKELDRSLAPLGGRMTDLQAFSRRLKSGERPVSAVLDMIDQSCVEILQMYLMRGSSEWTREQVWVLIKKLAALGEEDHARAIPKMDRSDRLLETNTDAAVSLGVLIQDPNFKTIEQQAALRALEHAEMITTHAYGGRIVSIKAGRPLYQAAFTALVCDRGLTAYMESYILENAMTKEEGKITAFEEELERLAKLGSNWRIKDRVNYVSDKLYDSQSKLVTMEKQLAEQKKILATSATGRD